MAIQADDSGVFSFVLWSCLLPASVSRFPTEQSGTKQSGTDHDIDVAKQSGTDHDIDVAGRPLLADSVEKVEKGDGFIYRGRRPRLADCCPSE